MRYFGQISGYLTLPLPDGDPVAALRELAAGFGDRHEREFGYALGPEIAEVELVNLRTACHRRGRQYPPQPPFMAAEGADRAQVDELDLGDLPARARRPNSRSCRSPKPAATRRSTATGSPSGRGSVK